MNVTGQYNGRDITTMQWECVRYEPQDGSASFLVSMSDSPGVYAATRRIVMPAEIAATWSDDSVVDNYILQELNLTPVGDQ